VELPLVELGDATLLPGLIDAHVHLAFDPGGDVSEHMHADDQATLTARMRQHALQALRAGITTVRYLGDRDYLALAVRDEYAATGTTAPDIGLGSGDHAYRRPLLVSRWRS
jgi:imidazolonepropionase-like amidohydrolase